MLSDYNGWPGRDEQELPVDYLTEKHRRLIVEKCSNHPNPAMPNLPYMPDETTGTSVRLCVRMPAVYCPVDDSEIDDDHPTKKKKPSVVTKSRKTTVKSKHKYDSEDDYNEDHNDSEDDSDIFDDDPPPTKKRRCGRKTKKMRTLQDALDDSDLQKRIAIVTAFAVSSTTNTSEQVIPASTSTIAIDASSVLTTIGSSLSTINTTSHYSAVFGDGSGTKVGCICCNEVNENNSRWSGAKLETSFNFLDIPEIQIPVCIHDRDLIVEASKKMRMLPGYRTDPHRFATVNYYIWIMLQLDPQLVSYVPILILKCTTIRLRLSLANWGAMKVGSNPNECPSFVAGTAISEVFARNTNNTINFGTGQSYAAMCARTVCQNNGDGHCDAWTSSEAAFGAPVIRIFTNVCARMNIPAIVICLGGRGGCEPFFNKYAEERMLFRGTCDEDIMRHRVHVVDNGMHFSTLTYWQYRMWSRIYKQVCHYKLCTVCCQDQTYVMYCMYLLFSD